MGSLGEAWEAEAEAWVAWAREPDHDSYWRFHRDAFLGIVPPPGRLTLDVGCGEGRLARDLALLGHRVVALDRSPTMARHAAASGGTSERSRPMRPTCPLPAERPIWRWPS
jgi:2-polyprenyl-3-methyl-5-hydroxy-6-metoxy-1,4-benzoquinol methylase